MTINTTWVHPEFDIVRAAHVEFVVTDLERAREFYVDLLGLVLTEATADALYLRGYEERDHHSLVLRLGERPEVGHLAFRVGSPDDLDRIAAHYRALGCRPVRVSSVESGQGEAIRVKDPLGFPVEYFYEIEKAERLLQRFDLYRGAHILRIDHFNLYVPNVDVAYDHYRRLGFRCSEYTVTDPPEQIWGATLYRKPTVHDVALMNGDGPRLHHIGFCIPDPTSILRTCDILAAAGKADVIERGPGRHGLSNALFLYMRDPDGYRVEITNTDYYTGDPDLEPIAWNVRDPRRGTFWGHVAPARWFDEASAVRDLDGGVTALQRARLAERPATVT